MHIRVVELFAGVGGFHKGLRDSGGYKVEWFNQWEPATKTVQWAHHCYVQNFHKKTPPPPHSNSDINEVPMDAIPQHDLLVGGFPCQDYSVATTLDKAAGIKGKKGVLWWNIDEILGAKTPPFVLLENVDRLVRSPADRRGRDFGIVLACLARRGYRAEWRVINAADYGFPQRRRRVFIFAAHKDTGVGEWMVETAHKTPYLYRDGFFAPQFNVRPPEALLVEDVSPSVTLPDFDHINEFEFDFCNAGVMVDGKVWTRRVASKGGNDAHMSMHIIHSGVNARYLLDESKLQGWQHAKGSKREPRIAKNGHEYHYAEGAMRFPDPIDAPARTILTSEANRTPNRSTHVIQDPKTKRLRYLTPLECERLMGFNDNWTKDIPERWRYFTMGNALVVGLVEKMGDRLKDVIKEHPTLVTAVAKTPRRKPVKKAARKGTRAVRA